MQKKTTKTGPYTCTGGYKLVAIRDVTRGDFIQMCERLSQLFGEGNEFQPEPITEGGIIWGKWPGCREGEYKTIRIGINHHKFKRRFINECGRKDCTVDEDEWPTILDDPMIAWKDDDTVLIHESKTPIATFLKAYHGAPTWEKWDLYKIAHVMEEFGLKRKSRVPGMKWLKEYGELGHRRE